jgi:hypothetical protein
MEAQAGQATLAQMELQIEAKVAVALQTFNFLVRVVLVW